MSSENEVECMKCGRMLPRLPGVSTSVLVAVAHVGPEGEPCPTFNTERWKKLSGVVVHERDELWDDDLRYAGSLASGDPEPADEDHVAVPDPDHWAGECRAEGVQW